MSNWLGYKIIDKIGLHRVSILGLLRLWRSFEIITVGIILSIILLFWRLSKIFGMYMLVWPLLINRLVLVVGQ